MDGVLGRIIFIFYLGFTTVVAGITLWNNNVTSHTHIIELCKDVGQFQYEKTVVLCEVKSNKTKE